MFGKFLRIHERRKTLGADVSERNQPPHDLRLKGSQSRRALGNFPENVAHLIVGYVVGAVGMRNQVVERDFGWVGHVPLTALG